MRTVFIANEQNFPVLQKVAKNLRVRGESQFILLKKEKIDDERMVGQTLIFSTKDLNVFGGLKSDQVKKTILERCNLLVVLGDIPKPFAKWLNQIPAQKRLGINTSSKLNFDVKLQTKDNEVQQITNFANEILEKIKP